MKNLIFVFLISLYSQYSYADTSVNKQKIYLAETFSKPATEYKIWLIGDKKTSVANILGHAYKQIRVGYWVSPNQPNISVWFLQEIGKDKYIDVAITINKKSIEKLRILEFRESRGWEVKLPFFTKQFAQNYLIKGHKLANTVDQISGATLSWRAVTKLARVALYLNTQRNNKRKNKPTLK